MRLSAGVTPLLGPEAFRVRLPAGVFLMPNFVDEGIVETCANCGVTGEHDVHIEIVDEGNWSNRPAYGREPYRVSTCGACGAVSRLRVNGM